MADIHVITGNNNQSWTLIMHFDIPDQNNAVGVNYRVALINSGLGRTTQLPDGDGTEGTISSDEKTSIESGSLYEYAHSIEIDGSGVSTDSRRTAIRLAYNNSSTAVIASLQRQLKFYGHIESRL